MKNVTKILALLLCVWMIITLCACGGNGAGAGSDSSDVNTKNDQTGGIVLPEDGTIPFGGKDNTSPDETAGADISEDATDTSGSVDPSGDTGWGDIRWN